MEKSQVGDGEGGGVAGWRCTGQGNYFTLTWGPHGAETNFIPINCELLMPSSGQNAGTHLILGFPSGSSNKESSAMQETQGDVCSTCGWGRSPEEEMATHCGIFA